MLKFKLLTLFALLISSINFANSAEVNIYSHRQPFLINPFLEAFSNKTGIKTNVVYSSKGLAQRLKAEGKNSWINGGFFVLNPNIFERIDGDNTSWEDEPLSSLAEDKQLKCFKHEGFWQPMDTLREKHFLQDLWESGNAPWKIW